MPAQKLAYSYIRFSSEKQQLGDSLRRQITMAEDYAARHDMVLDTHSYRDMGMSAYKGRNAVEGKLSAFLRAVDGGFVLVQSYLLVESLDRLSRHEVDEALELFLSIIRRGITIVLCQTVMNTVVRLSSEIIEYH
jgi:DNA invertase Pin-like site-specific DNA recombinase